MQHKNSIITSCLALAHAGTAHAAGVWSTINWTDDTQLSFITSTNVTHSGDFDGPSQTAATINDYTFEPIHFTVGGNGFGGLPSNPYSGSNFTVGSTGGGGLFTYNASAGVTGAASSKLSDGLAGSNWGEVTVTYNLTGLLTNTNYEFYFFNPDWTGGATRTGFLDGSDDGVGNTFAIDQTPGAGDKIIKYAYNTGASTTFTMRATSNNTAGLHNFAFVNVVPEPSAALLGGLGMLALLRRRR
jgi:hypothetical protein